MRPLRGIVSLPQVVPSSEGAAFLFLRGLSSPTHDDPEGGPELLGLPVISFVLGLLRAFRHLVVLTVQALRVDSSRNRPYEHDTSVAVVARERGFTGLGAQALPIIGTGETKAVLAAHIPWVAVWRRKPSRYHTPVSYTHLQ